MLQLTALFWQCPVPSTESLYVVNVAPLAAKAVGTAASAAAATPARATRRASRRVEPRTCMEFLPPVDGGDPAGSHGAGTVLSSTGGEGNGFAATFALRWLNAFRAFTGGSAATDRPSGIAACPSRPRVGGRRATSPTAR